MFCMCVCVCLSMCVCVCMWGGGGGGGGGLACENVFLISSRQTFCNSIVDLRVGGRTFPKFRTLKAFKK